eukprot:TRINITY_DN22427_c0_g1_i1.p1 TRINITY_DN22427_c0_g1~~TRINITY_DN22427_c0_g1_i1.p1  ORF type:complete len:112 (-),score=22.70 TRINITY_DN22427_c0_g1_i1:90-425(-)
MKGFELLENYCKAKKNKAPSAKLPLLKKVDLLHTFYKEMKAYDKKKLVAMRKQIADVLDLLCDEGSGALFTRLIAKVYEQLFSQADESRLPEFFDKEIQRLSCKSETAYQL